MPNINSVHDAIIGRWLYRFIRTTKTLYRKAAYGMGVEAAHQYLAWAETHAALHNPSSDGVICCATHGEGSADDDVVKNCCFVYDLLALAAQAEYRLAPLYSRMTPV